MAVATLDGEALQIEAMPYPTYHDDTLKGDGLATNPLGINMDTMSAANVEKLKRLLGVDETVLFNDTSKAGADPAENYHITISESIANFKYIEITYSRFRVDTVSSDVPSIGVQTIRHDASTLTTTTCSVDSVAFVTNGTFYNSWCLIKGFNTTTLNVWSAQKSENSTTVSSLKCYLNPIKIVGIHRIAGGNN